MLSRLSVQSIPLGLDIDRTVSGLRGPSITLTTIGVNTQSGVRRRRPIAWPRMVWNIPTMPAVVGPSFEVCSRHLSSYVARLASLTFHRRRMYAAQESQHAACHHHPTLPPPYDAIDPHTVDLAATCLDSTDHSRPSTVSHTSFLLHQV